MASDADIVRCAAPWPGTAARLLEGLAALTLARANLPRFRIRLKLPCALKGSYYPGSLGGEPWRSVFGLCLFFTRRIFNILNLFNKRVRSPKQLCPVTDTTQHPDLIQVVEGFTSPHDRS